MSDTSDPAPSPFDAYKRAKERTQEKPSGDATTIRDLKGDGGEGALLHIKTTATLREACEFLSERRIGLVLVCDAEGSLAGVLSERDVVRAIAEHGSDALRAACANFITRDVFTCTSTDLVVDVARTMSARRFRHLPIVDDGTLAGMVSATDIVDFFANQQN